MSKIQFSNFFILWSNLHCSNKVIQVSRVHKGSLKKKDYDSENYVFVSDFTYVIFASMMQHKNLSFSS